MSGQAAHEEIIPIDEVTPAHKASITHDLVASAAVFAASKAWIDHQAKAGKPTEHAVAYEALAGLIGGAVDHLVESKGLDWIDRQKAKHQAKEAANEILKADGLEPAK